MHLQTMTELTAGLERGDFTSVELTQALLDRIAAHDDALNAFVTVTATEALEAAARADESRASGNVGALNGLPIIHKDIFCTRGVKTSCGSKMLDNFISPYDATVVEKLAAAGAVVLGKSNMDEFAMGSSNETSPPCTARTASRRGEDCCRPRGTGCGPSTGLRGRPGHDRRTPPSPAASGCCEPCR